MRTDDEAHKELKEHLVEIEKALVDIKTSIAVLSMTLQSHAKIINGENSPSLSVRLDRLERIAGFGMRFSYGLASAVALLMLNRLWEILAR